MKWLLWSYITNSNILSTFLKKIALKLSAQLYITHKDYFWIYDQIGQSDWWMDVSYCARVKALPDTRQHLFCIARAADAYYWHVNARHVLCPSSWTSFYPAALGYYLHATLGREEKSSPLAACILISTKRGGHNRQAIMSFSLGI